VFFVVVLLLTLLLDNGVYVFVAGGGGMTRAGPFDGRYAVPSASAKAESALERWLTCWIGEEDERLLAAAEDVDVNEGELPIFIGLERVSKPFVLALNVVAPLIGVMLPELLGVVIPALEALPLPGLLLRGTNSVGDTVDPGEASDLPETSSMGVGIEVLWLRGCWLKRPLLISAFPPAYTGRLLQQLHPVKKMPRLHAPIKPAKGILPIVIILPRVIPFTRRPNPGVSCHRPARLRRQCSLLPRIVGGT
jgi:hypothetical protein